MIYFLWAISHEMKFKTKLPVMAIYDRRVVASAYNILLPKNIILLSSTVPLAKSGNNGC